jgi:hypothetical protein
MSSALGADGGTCERLPDADARAGADFEPVDLWSCVQWRAEASFSGRTYEIKKRREKWPIRAFGTCQRDSMQGVRGPRFPDCRFGFTRGDRLIEREYSSAKVHLFENIYAPCEVCYGCGLDPELFADSG